VVSHFGARAAGSEIIGANDQHRNAADNERPCVGSVPAAR